MSSTPADLGHPAAGNSTPSKPDIYKVNNDAVIVQVDGKNVTVAQAKALENAQTPPAQNTPPTPAEPTDLTKLVEQSNEKWKPSQTILVSEVDHDLFQQYGVKVDIATKVASLSLAPKPRPKDVPLDHTLDPTIHGEFYGPLAVIQLPRHKIFTRVFSPALTVDGSSIYQSLHNKLQNIWRNSENVLIVQALHETRIWFFNVTTNAAVTEFNAGNVHVHRNGISSAKVVDVPLKKMMEVTLPTSGTAEPYKPNEKLFIGKEGTKGYPFPSDTEKAELVSKMPGATVFRLLKNRGETQAVTFSCDDTPENRATTHRLGGVFSEVGNFGDDSKTARRGRLKFSADFSYGDMISFARLVQSKDPSFQAVIENFNLRFIQANKVTFTHLNNLKTIFIANIKAYADVRPEAKTGSAFSKIRDGVSFKDAGDNKPEPVNNDNLLVMVCVGEPILHPEVANIVAKTFNGKIEHITDTNCKIRVPNAEIAKERHLSQVGAGEIAPYMLIMYDQWHERN